jgi:uncharacterized phage-like protein YoqJ
MAGIAGQPTGNWVHVMILTTTGHRPPRLGLDYSEASRLLLVDFAREQLAWLQKDYRITSVIAGAAQGWDQAVMVAALEVGLPVVAAIPFEGQENRWPSEDQERYRELLTRCEVLVWGGGHSKAAYLKRDERMVDASKGVLACYDGGDGGGTAHTVAYAHKQKKPLWNCWTAWEIFLRKGQIT